MSPVFSLLHTTARLPQGWQAAHRAWLENCVNPKDVEYVMVVDNQDQDKWPGFPDGRETWGDIKLAVNEKRACPVDGWNKAAEVSSGQFLITVADDIRPCKRWDEEIRRVVPDMAKEVVLDVNNGAKAVPGFLYFSFLTRARYERLGYIFYPEYWGYKGDDDFTAEAWRDKVVVRARHLVFPHLHPSYDLSKSDEIYKRQRATDLMGTKIFNRRWGARSFTDYLQQSTASYIVRSPGANRVRVEVPAATGSDESLCCPKCRSAHISALPNAGNQLRCRSCSLIFPASRAALDSVDIPAKRPSTIDALQARVAELGERLERLEKQFLSSGEPAKGEQWSASALRN